MSAVAVGARPTFGHAIPSTVELDSPTHTANQPLWFPTGGKNINKFGHGRSRPTQFPFALAESQAFLERELHFAVANTLDCLRNRRDDWYDNDWIDLFTF